MVDVLLPYMTAMINASLREGRLPSSHRHALSHFNDNGMMPRLQSAYRRHHSTETALVKVLSDIYAGVDEQQVTLLGLLDLSAAFDCVDRNVLLH